jgi:hypothetical protein
MPRFINVFVMVLLSALRRICLFASSCYSRASVLANSFSSLGRNLEKLMSSGCRIWWSRLAARALIFGSP